jgi:hypothetical protein
MSYFGRAEQYNNWVSGTTGIPPPPPVPYKSLTNLAAAHLAKHEKARNVGKSERPSETIDGDNSEWDDSTARSISPAREQDGLIEVERPTWVALVILTQLIVPDLAIHLVPALDVGSHPPVPFTMNPDACQAINMMISSIWGEGVVITVPVLRFEPNIYAPLEIGGPTRVLEGLAVVTQVHSASSTDRRERRILRDKETFQTEDPMTCLKLGLSHLFEPFPGMSGMYLNQSRCLRAVLPAGSSSQSLGTERHQRSLTRGENHSHKSNRHHRTNHLTPSPIYIGKNHRSSSTLTLHRRRQPSLLDVFKGMFHN